METYIAVVIFIFGMIFGSFLNVILYRYNSGRSTGGRSACLSCGKHLAWHELIPAISFFIQKGKCRGCGSKISIQYPLVELGTGLLFILSYYYLGALHNFDNIWEILKFALLLDVMCFSVLIFTYDLKHKIIPDTFSIPLAVAALILLLISNPLSHFGTTLGILDLAAGPILFIFFFLFWWLSKGRAMGLGDAKLALTTGWLLGAKLALSGLFLAFIIGAIVGLFFMLISRLKVITNSVTMKSEIPFAPFLILGTLIILFSGIDITGISTIFDLGI